MKAWERKRRDCGVDLTEQILREEDESLGEKEESLLCNFSVYVSVYIEE
jgi:hypothetical protein